MVLPLCACSTGQAGRPGDKGDPGLPGSVGEPGRDGRPGKLHNVLSSKKDSYSTKTLQQYLIVFIDSKQK